MHSLPRLIPFLLAATQIHSSLLSISVGAVLLPAAYHFSISGDSEAASIDQRVDILQMSHGVRILQLQPFVPTVLNMFVALGRHYPSGHILRVLVLPAVHPPRLLQGQGRKVEDT